MKIYVKLMGVGVAIAMCAVIASCTQYYSCANRELSRATPIHDNRKAWHDTTRERMSIAGNAEGKKLRHGSTEVAKKANTPPKYLDRMVDDVWIIERPKVNDVAKASAGAKEHVDRADLVVRDPDTNAFIPIPLKHTEVAAKVTGFASEVKVTQRYHNPFSKTIEATYVFPLPHDSAVTDFVMTIGKRKIRGIIREREEAQRIYDEARRLGYRAALMTQERPNVFTQKVANVEPGKAIDVEIVYFNTLRHENGVYEFIFPMVVGPRYNPPGTENPIVPKPATAATSLETVSTHYLAPNQRSGRDVSIHLDVNAGIAIESVRSPSHEVEATVDGSVATVKLKQSDGIPNKDFIVQFTLAGKVTKHGVMTSTKTGSDGHVSLMVMPPADMASLERIPREMIFVVDCSGSMSGRPMKKAKEAMVNCLKGMHPDDRFQIIKFSSTASSLGAEPIPATAENVKKALSFVKTFGGSGGTRMIEGIKAALDMPHESGTLRIVSFMTDGFIGNEREILDTIYKKLGEARVFSFGVGSSVNRYLIEGMAQVGKGAAAYVGLDADSGKVVDLFYQRCARPAMTDVTIDWGGLKVAEVYPKYLPDVFVGRPLTVTGVVDKYSPTRGQVTVKGRVGGQWKQIVIPVDLIENNVSGNALASIWARAKLKEMAFMHALEPSPKSKQTLVDFSIKHKVLCAQTAFIAVDTTTRVSSPTNTSVPVPSPMPNGVDYSKTVEEDHHEPDE